MKKDYAILLNITFLALLLPHIITNDYYLTVLIIIGIHAILVLGLNMLMGYAGQVSLGHAAFYALGAYFSGVLTATHGLSPWTAMLVAIVATSVVALIVAMPTLKLEGHYLAMATLGIGIIIQKLIEEFGKITGGNNGLTNIPMLSIGDYRLDSDGKFYHFIVAVLFILMVFSINIVHSRVGRACRAIHSSRLAAHIMGVNVHWMKVQIFILSAAYASIAGSIYAHYMKYLDPSTFGFHTSIELVVMVVLGGLGNVWGGILGAAIVNLLKEYIAEFAEYGPIVFGIILIVMVLFIPNGLAGAISKLSKISPFKKRGAAS